MAMKLLSQGQPFIAIRGICSNLVQYQSQAFEDCQLYGQVISQTPRPGWLNLLPIMTVSEWQGRGSSPSLPYITLLLPKRVCPPHRVFTFSEQYKLKLWKGECGKCLILQVLIYPRLLFRLFRAPNPTANCLTCGCIQPSEGLRVLFCIQCQSLWQ